MPGIERSPIPTVYLYHQKVLSGRSIWALIVPKYHEFFFAFVDKSIGARNDELMALTRKTLRAKYGNQEGEKISMQNYSEDQEAGADINKKL